MLTIDASRAELASRLRHAIARTARRLRQEGMADEGGAPGPTLTAALATIDTHGPLTPSELAERERVRRPTATRIVGRLEDEGLIERSADPGDRRSSLVRTSPAGRALLRRLRRRKDEYLSLRLAELSADDLVALERAADVLERLADPDRAPDRREGV